MPISSMLFYLSLGLQLATTGAYLQRWCGRGLRRLSSPALLLAALALVVILIPLALLLPQLFLLDRTDAQCRWLHRTAAWAAYLSAWLSQLYFLMRANQIAVASPPQRTLGRLLIVAALVMLAYGLVGMMRTMRTAVVGRVCVAYLDAAHTALSGFVLPYLFKVVLAARFVALLLTSDGHVRAPWRLIRLSCAVSCATTVTDIVLNLPVLGLVPVSDPATIVALINANCTVNACATGWPTILVGQRRPPARTVQVVPSPVARGSLPYDQEPESDALQRGRGGSSD